MSIQYFTINQLPFEILCEILIYCDDVDLKIISKRFFEATKWIAKQVIQELYKICASFEPKKIILITGSEIDKFEYSSLVIFRNKFRTVIVHIPRKKNPLFGTAWENSIKNFYYKNMVGCFIYF